MMSSSTSIDDEQTILSASRAQVLLLGVYEISRVLTAPLQLPQALSQVANLLPSFLDFDHGMIVLFDEAGEPDLVVNSHASPSAARSYYDELPEEAIGRVVVTQMPVVVEDTRDDPVFVEAAAKRGGFSSDSGLQRSFVGVPIKERGRVVGVLSIDRTWSTDQRHSFSFDADVRFLGMIANLLGQTLRLQQLVARDRGRLLEDKTRLEKALGDREGVELGRDKVAGIVGESAALRSVLEKVRVVARSHTTVLLRGESGTGKELFARALHDLSPRRQRPFVSLNCAALPESVLESELFGHEKGAFTGALQQRKGRFELADKGTLFLDEIGEISAAFQAKLLRVLQLGEFERVGGTGTLTVDVRLVAATNRNLEEAVARGDFRADLYYRISVVPIVLPPLRERVDDIPLLACEFLERFNRENSTSLELSCAAIDVLKACYFPGNVRELENCVRRTATLASGRQIAAGDFACSNDECLSALLWHEPKRQHDPSFVPLPITRGPLRPRGGAAFADATHAGHGRCAGSDDAADGVDANAVDAPSERERLIDVMESVGWVQAKAARVLGLTPRQVGYALRKHEIPIKKF